MPKVIFKDKSLIADVEKGLSLLETALRFDVPIYHTCGGNCSCSTCRVIVLKGAANLSEIEPPEAEILDSFDLKAPYRLGCQAAILKGEVEVRMPPRDKAPRPNKTPPLPKE